jgi:SpoVK/Ycf46/Vps4 family AAA+-type ATPase
MPDERALPFIKKIRFRTTWDKRSLSPQVLEKLEQIRSACRENPRTGLPILFSGPHGTGKTMAAEILAHELNLDLYRVNLQAVVSKYIDETEKNLAKVFETVERASSILLLDEGDALFGKRSGVRDVHDRHADREISVLLRRMETHAGICIVAGNFERNLDSAFQRRFRFHVRF